MKTSFISTVLNEEKNIGDFLDSLLSQNKKPDEIIIVDGGSNDGTYQILKDYAKRNKKIEIFQHKGANIAKGRNLAISKAKGEIIFVSDAGCKIDPAWIEDTLKYFPKEDVVAGNYRAITKNDFELFQSKIVIKKVDRPSRMSSRNIVFKKKCWKEVGGYPELYRTGEDNRFDIELIHKGYKIKVNQKPLVSWEMRPSLIKFAKQFYDYGKGDRIQKNLLKKSIKKNLAMVVVFWIYIIAMIYFAFTNYVISLGLIIFPLALLLIYSIKYLIQTKKISALFWVPVLVFTKRLSYILGVTFR